MIALIINSMLLIFIILRVGRISDEQHEDIKEEIKKLNDNINQLKKD